MANIGFFNEAWKAAMQRMKSPVQTERAIMFLQLLSSAGMLALAAVGFQLGLNRGISFFAWSFIAAVAAAMSGGLLGLLFGLPAARHAVPDGANAQNYIENTSLEQIADWLTKIIVGLTLTQFTLWAEHFDNLSAALTHDLLCPTSPASCGSVPGGSLIAAYSLMGFGMAFLWTRRFFMIELAARDEAIQDMARAQQQREQASKEGRVQREDQTLVEASESARIVDAILEDGRRNASGPAKDTAKKLKAGQFPDDPWHGVFGSAVTKEAVISATVSEAPEAPEEYKVEITVSGTTPQAQQQLAGQKALFYLHPTFGSHVQIVPFGADGRATLVIYAYGAFTVGALLQDGSTLELDLASLPGAPGKFLAR